MHGTKEAPERGPCPSTTLRVVPLPRFTGGEDGRLSHEGEASASYRSPAQKRWMRLQASSSCSVAVA